VRLLTTILALILALPLAAIAAERNSADAAGEIAGHCCECAKQCGGFEPVCHTVEFKHCEAMCHKAVTPYKPCAPCLDELCACHKPLMAYEPCAPCLEPLCPCHKLATPLHPVVCCDCRIELTGSRDLICPAGGCGCDCHGEAAAVVAMSSEELHQRRRERRGHGAHEHVNEHGDDAAAADGDYSPLEYDDSHASDGIPASEGWDDSSSS
jgi:hypothetical protein